MSLRCTSCNTTFNDKGSLDVHYRYNHSNQLIADGGRPVEPDAESSGVVVESNNNNNNNNHQHFFKYRNSHSGGNQHDEPVMTAISPGNAETPEFHLQSPPHYDQPPPQRQQNYENYLMANAASQEYSCASSSIIQNANTTYLFSEQRYHPYYKHHMPHFKNILKCDKCNMQFASQEMLLHHFSLAHGSILSPHSSNRFGDPLNGGAEPQAEILDLDSQKVHLYQPPNGDDSQDSDHRSVVPWARDEKKHFHQQLHISQKSGPANNGRGDTPLSSPDFGRVSTTTDTTESMQLSTQSSYYEGRNVNSTSPMPHISSTDNTAVRSSSKRAGGGKNSNSTWKSNEPRRPKTYNCSACNKWFTSSGHLKRHYNTTLHKNAVKQSGGTDPATLPVSAHHHPQKELAYPSSRQHESLSPTQSETPTAVKLDSGGSGYDGQQPTNAFIHNSPNLLAGPTEIPGGLLHLSYSTRSHPGHKSPSLIISLQQQQKQQSAQQLSNHTSYLPFTGATAVVQRPQQHQQPTTLAPFFRQATPTLLYPNFQSPHVSTTRRITTSNRTGNLREAEDVLSSSSCICESKLPSFTCIQKSNANNNSNSSNKNNNNTDTRNEDAEQFLSTLDNGNVGGAFSSKEVENAPTIIIKLEEVSDIDDVGWGLEESSISSSTTTMGGGLLGMTMVKPMPAAGGKFAFSCDKCHKFFNKACYLTQHNKCFHSGFKPFKCARCGKRFPDSVQYKIHADKHAADKPYKCEVCPKAFNHKTDLRRHACLHTNVRPFNCDICSNGFIRKDHMLKHRETHQNHKSVRAKVPSGETEKKGARLRGDEVLKYSLIGVQ